MKTTEKTLTVAMALALLLGFTGPLYAQGGAGARRGGQQQQAVGQKQGELMQERQLVQAQEMQQRMHRILERAHQLNRELTQQAARQHSGLMTQNRELQRICESVEGMAQHMNRVMEGSRNMLGDPALARDRQMQRELERLRERMDDVAGQMENTLQIMERLQQRG